MIRLTNLADYAVVLMCRIAKKPDTLHSAQHLGQETGIPVTTVSKILGALAKADLLSSHRGLKGGFKLGKALGKITMADIIEAIDGPIALTNCIEHTPGECCFETGCMMRPHWQAINGAVKNALTGISLQEIAFSTGPFSITGKGLDSRVSQ